MKSSKVVLFIFAVLLMLGALCAVFPASGVSFAGTTLSFPTLEQALRGGKSGVAAEDTVHVETPEEILARRLAELRTAEESRYEDFARNSSIRIFFPDNDLSLFDRFFDSLDSAMVHPVRIVHYGDSQLEEDRITNNVREQLQNRFGGGGVGLVPLIQTYTTLTLRQKRSGSAPRSIVYGTKDFSVPGGRYGPMGQVARLSGNMDISYTPNPRIPENHHSRHYNRVTILTDTAHAPLKIYCPKGTVTMDSLSRPMRRYFIELPDTSESVGFRLNGNADVYGVMLDAERGVSLDNVAMRGCSGTIFNRIDAGQLSDYYKTQNVSLIILQYGGNAVPYMKVGKALDTFAQKIHDQILYVRRQAPDAAVLFIGPSDMSTSVGGVMKTYPALPAIIDSLRSAANRAGAAYWDLYTVMGGQNSMTEWVKTGYAGRDYIHFTHKGADEVGNLLAKSLLLYYDYYKWRNKPLGEQLTPEMVSRLMAGDSCDASPDSLTRVILPADSLLPVTSGSLRRSGAPAAARVFPAATAATDDSAAADSAAGTDSAARSDSAAADDSAASSAADTASASAIAEPSAAGRSADASASAADDSAASSIADSARGDMDPIIQE